MSNSSEKNPLPPPSRRQQPTKPTPVRHRNLYDLLPLYFSPVGVTWLPSSNSDSPAETPAAIAAKLFEQAAQAQAKHRSFKLTGGSENVQLLADAGRRVIRERFQEDTEQGLLIRASLKLRRQLAKATGWALLGVMPLVLTAIAITLVYGGRRGGPLPPVVVAALVILWCVQVAAISITVMTQIAEVPQGRTFLPFRGMALLPVFHAFLASGWLTGIAIAFAYRHSWTAFGSILTVVMISSLVSVYTRAYLLKSIEKVVLDDAERLALQEWCTDGKITPPGPESMQPASFFRSQGRWAWWRIGAMAVWLVATAFAAQFGSNQVEVVGLGVLVFAGLYLGYRAGFHILARINPYDLPNGLLSTATGIVFFSAVFGTLVQLLPPAPPTPVPGIALPPL